MICGLGKEATRKNAKSWFLLATFGNLFFFQFVAGDGCYMFVHVLALVAIVLISFKSIEI